MNRIVGGYDGLDVTWLGTTSMPQTEIHRLAEAGILKPRNIDD